ncbi:MAG: exodeoxyribonuclease VII large subunit, partial [Halothiobacillaceae bacterium]
MIAESVQTIPIDTGFADAAPVQTPAEIARDDAPAGQGLYNYLSAIQQVVRNQIPPAWVRAEVSQISRRNGNIYIDLVEHDAHGQIIAKVRAVIWRNAAFSIVTKFEQGAGAALEADIKVMIKVRAELHPQYGLAVVISDIDPAYTLGDMEAKLRQIRAHLRDKGIYDINRSLPQPGEFTRVAVIAPSEAAGLGDFRREADLLAAHGVCTFDYQTATFQGREAPKAIYSAMRSLWEDHQVTPYDALVIIRGGGARADLQWLNDLRLAEAICRISIPVFTGIGHERDNTILDEVATRFDTPSKVIRHIAETITRNATQAAEDWKFIGEVARQQVMRAHQEAEGLIRLVGESAHGRLQLAREQADRTHAGIGQQARTLLHLSMSRVQGHREDMERHTRQALGRAGQEVEHHRSDVTMLVQREMDAARMRLDDLARGVAGRARSLVRDAGRQVLGLGADVRDL